MELRVRAWPVDGAGIGHRIAGAEQGDLGAHRLHDAGGVKAEDAGGPLRRDRRGADLHVHRIHRDRLHAHQQVLRPQLRHRHLQVEEGVSLGEGKRLQVTDGFHGWMSCLVAGPMAAKMRRCREERKRIVLISMSSFPNGSSVRFPDLEIDLLRAFVAVAETGGFTAAAQLVGRSQSAVSQKILRLEDLLGCRVFARTSRSLTLTREGENLLVSARRMLELNDRAVRALLEPAVGSLRLGVCEDFLPDHLPAMLARFRRLYPGLHLELRTGLSCELLAAYEAGALDVVIAKKDGTARRGRVIWREQLVWMAAGDHVPDFEQPAPLVLLPAPCTYREVMIRALDAARRPWFAACTASSLSGIRAAVAGGLGVTVLGRSFVGPDMQVLRAPEHWPALPMTEIVLVGEERAAADVVRPLVHYLTQRLSTTAA